MSKRDRSQKTKSTQITYNRRTALLLGGAGAVALAGGGLAYLLRSNDRNGFSFLSQPVNPPVSWNLSVKEVMQLGCPIGKTSDRYSPEEGEEYLELFNDFINERLEKINAPDQEFKVDFVEDFYGYPAERIHAADAEDYSRRLLSFLAAHVRGLNHGSPEFVRLETGQKFQNSFCNKVFIGRNGYNIVSATVKDPSGRTVLSPMKKTSTVDGCSSVLKVPEEGASYDPKQNWAFIQAGPKCLLGICSEIIPWTTVVRTIEYSKKVGRDSAITADETIAEGMSYIISLEAAREFGVPNGENILNQINKEVAAGYDVYRLVPQSISWLQKNGVQNGFDLYMDDPAKYMAAIQQI